jgi:hypothetical protein
VSSTTPTKISRRVLPGVHHTGLRAGVRHLHAWDSPAGHDSHGRRLISLLDRPRSVAMVHKAIAEKIRVDVTR